MELIAVSNAHIAQVCLPYGAAQPPIRMTVEPGGGGKLLNQAGHVGMERWRKIIDRARSGKMRPMMRHDYSLPCIPCGVPSYQILFEPSFMGAMNSHRI